MFGPRCTARLEDEVVHVMPLEMCAAVFKSWVFSHQLSQMADSAKRLRSLDHGYSAVSVLRRKRPSSTRTEVQSTCGWLLFSVLLSIAERENAICCGEEKTGVAMV